MLAFQKDQVGRTEREIMKKLILVGMVMLSVSCFAEEKANRKPSSDQGILQGIPGLIARAGFEVVAETSSKDSCANAMNEAMQILNRNNMTITWIDQCNLVSTTSGVFQGKIYFIK